MDFDQIEKLKQQYTDKYVVVDESRPELARFGNQTGLIKTVNMNGRALVQFDAWNNIAWYDIELDFLKVVPKPDPSAQEHVSKTAPKAAVNAKSAVTGAPGDKAPLGKTTPVAAKPAAAKPAAAGKLSTADILAAARAKKAEGSAAAPAVKAPKPAAAKPAAAPKPGGKMSTAEILAAARAAKLAASPSAPVEEQPVQEEEPSLEPVLQAKPGTKSASKPTAGAMPNTTAEKIHWCRERDAKA